METLADRLKRILHVESISLRLRRKPKPLYPFPEPIIVYAQGKEFKAHNLEELEFILEHFKGWNAKQQPDDVEV